MPTPAKRALLPIDGSGPMNFSVRAADRAQIKSYCEQMGIGKSDLLHRLLALARRGRHDLANVQNRLALLIEEIRTGALQPLEVAGALRIIIGELEEIAEPMVRKNPGGPPYPP